MKRRMTDRVRLGGWCLTAVLLCVANLAISTDVSAKPGHDRFPEKGQGKGRLKKTQENSPPTISGTPVAAVLENAFYDFVPNASDANGDTLTYAITNKPGWADFDPTTGALYGTPTTADVGQYPSIRIAVSDGIATAALPDFAIDVTSTASGAVALSWQAPTENTDGTPLTDLAGFRIYYGVDPADLSNVIELSNPSLSTYLVEGLTPDVWYFASTALNSRGQESDLSSQVAKDIR